MHKNIEIRMAQNSPVELEQVAKILQEGAARMKALGQTQWEADLLEPAHLRSAIEAQELFVVVHDEHVVGTFKVQTEDPEFWPEMPLGEALYLHKIAVTERCRGQGLTGEIVQWAKRYAVKMQRKYLRLDTDHARPGLCELYGNLGFSFHSYKDLDWIKVKRFEMASAR